MDGVKSVETVTRRGEVSSAHLKLDEPTPPVPLSFAPRRALPFLPLVFFLLLSSLFLSLHTLCTFRINIRVAFATTQSGYMYVSFALSSYTSRILRCIRDVVNKSLDIGGNSRESLLYAQCRRAWPFYDKNFMWDHIPNFLSMSFFLSRSFCKKI